ncbi:succinyl-diaminopimelate desuccinylase [Moraxella caviae]|uniref:Succinyl-diaminopimelate desuccinylase n=1 Tax=Moraxella caviae TaxID=34060 RepID=A0A1S9ZZP3_9GAMM|nr:succinyl-diaminopimelate desuccinylase [Moraxella caviae]OOR88849.1 succinyl-diaminopimelate desuccinylase [Moraxella caviae]STZ10210.1 Succinyl-diaminopimelate desuccinylase [Moraxella caviae]VEW12372.1 Succinyl-diaminopimelate desuccinylase [Moraxella caviae]
MTQTALSLSIELIKEPSITPNDCACQDILIKELAPFGFECELMPFGDESLDYHAPNGKNAQIKNLWAIKKGADSSAPVLCFAGHTDVVPTGDEAAWTYPPFSATVADGFLWGRGAADMKTGVAAFTVAAQNFINKHPNHKGSIALLITADEEGVAINGTKKVVDALKARGEKIDYCLVGEPSSTATLGDVIKNGRRGSLNARLTVTGKQGHIAYPHLAVNPIHALAPALNELIATTWDNGNDYFDATSLQVSNINSGTGATNVIAQTAEVLFNFRFCTENTAETLKAKTHAIFDKHFAASDARYEIEWNLSGEPFLTEKGAFVDACTAAIKAVTGTDSKLSTSGGTSDGRFIAPVMNAQVVELGVLNATIHQIDERVAVADVENLAKIYERILEEMVL